MFVAKVSVDCANIRSWESFHDQFAAAFGFPDFYGRNMDAWIDCMTSLDEPDHGMTRIHATKGNVITMELENVAPFREQHPDLYAAIIECAALVNSRRVKAREPAVLAISFRN
jgi:hypothetical protein